MTAEKTSTTQVVNLKPIDKRTVLVHVVGTSSLITHKWSEKALITIRDKQKGRKAKTRETRDPEAEALAATYFTADGRPGVPVTAVKKAIITAAHKDIGIEKTLVRKSVFVVCGDPNGVLPIDFEGEPVIREDTVRVGNANADLRYRPEFRKWSLTFTAELDGALMQPDDFFNLINRAGFGVGICEWRPEKGGDNGRFEVANIEES